MRFKNRVIRPLVFGL